MSEYYKWIKSKRSFKIRDWLPQLKRKLMGFRNYFGLPDQVFDIDLTPNRSDCLGLAGVAREVGVLNKLSVSHPAIEPVASTIDDTFLFANVPLPE